MDPTLKYVANGQTIPCTEDVSINVERTRCAAVAQLFLRIEDLRSEHFAWNSCSRPFVPVTIELHP